MLSYNTHEKSNHSPKKKKAIKEKKKALKKNVEVKVICSLSAVHLYIINFTKKNVLSFRRNFMIYKNQQIIKTHNTIKTEVKRNKLIIII